MSAQRWLRRAALLAGGVALGAAAFVAIVLCVAAAGGVLTTPPGAWAVRLSPLPGVAIRLSVPGLARFAASPLALRLLDGRSVATRHGLLQFRRDGDALLASCAPCRVDAPLLAAQPVRFEALRLRLRRAGAQALSGELTGEAAGGDVRVPFTAQLRPDRVDVDWRLPPTGIDAAYRLLGSVIPEAHLARIEGRIEARGSLRLPQRRARVELALDGFAVDGLGTGALAAGPVAFACPDAAALPQSRSVMPGEGRWISPARSGALLASAVLAAEDQRFGAHEGFDRVEIARVLASIDEGGPARGASTVTQQLARTLYTGGERTAARKLRELLYAVEMERTLGKDAILALYLNTVHWGPGICGADAAARVYFGKRPQQLTPLEAAWLASILPDPERAYADDFLAGAADPTRAGQVLWQMHALPRAQRAFWSGRPLVFAAPPAAATTRLAAGR